MKNEDRVRMNQCSYCPKKNPHPNTFIIGAKREKSDDFVMVEGTGKMACGDCYPKAAEEGQRRIDAHIASVNAKARRPSGN